MKRFLERFVWLHAHERAFGATVGLFAGYMLAGSVSGFDVFPWPLLTLIVSLWAILLSLATLYLVEHIHSEHLDDPPKGGDEA